jgi:hypothetical protein
MKHTKLSFGTVALLAAGQSSSLSGLGDGAARHHPSQLVQRGNAALDQNHHSVLKVSP